MKIYDANEQYLKYLNNDIMAQLEVSTPNITSKGFNVNLYEISSSGEDIVFNLFVEAKDIEVSVTYDRIAYIIAVLSMQKYDYIKFDFEICRKTLTDIQNVTHAEIEANNILEDVETVIRNKFSLCISGGIDSTTLRKLCPDLIPIALNFTTNGKGEELIDIKTAKSLGSIVVVTNASEFLFPHYSFGYYNVGSLLLADALDIGISANGAIMGDTAKSWAHGSERNPVINGVSTISPLAGFSKVGVFKLLHKLDPDFYDTFNDNWFHYPVNGAEIKKTARVRLLIDAAITGKIRDVKTRLPRLSASANIFYTAYFINKLGIDVVDKYFNNLSDDLLNALSSVSTEFLEKYDQNELEKIPHEFRGYFEKQLNLAGVEYYTEKDYASRQNIVDMLGL
ncbi:MAG: hypothetical protein LBR74_05715 [Eubacterium sp.]|jgi:hypothetical protein|nr:hypothetical protein [Eubacterium sp.]